eukprot:comp29850_c0_seq1/m.47230 comp29850_c0_seq1/g.47230  ORF comp29850_c0_seq1/g.47230 comp29850_c0_seq1/m.47230 type:complete len:101 (-) comp29850_c0_seq1:154-456(-)
MDPVREAAIRTKILEQLTQSGQKDKLKEHLRSRLAECGWRDDVTNKCRDLYLDKVKEKGSVDKVSMEDVVGNLTKYGRSRIPDDVKRALLDEIKETLAKM